MSRLLSLARHTAKTLLPRSVVNWLTRQRRRQRDRAFENLTPEQIFTTIYESKLWGGDSAEGYYSGSGSHDARLVAAYVDAVRSWCLAHPDMDSAVDLGCGDFAIGSAVHSSFRCYTACDVVPGLIEHNRSRFADLKVEFRTVDMIADPLPPARVCMIRQVLQHLSNAQIAQVLQKVSATYDVLIVTEHLPAGEFTPNRDKPCGPAIRLQSEYSPSGVVLTEPPFNLDPARTQVIADVADDYGRVVTTVHWLREPGPTADMPMNASVHTDPHGVPK